MDWPAYILLPFCNDLNCDVFLNILKKIVSKTRMEHYLEVALISGMKKNKLVLKLEPNKSLNQCSDIDRATLLGYWCVKNFPSFGENLLGEKWNPSECRKVIIGKTGKVVTEKDIKTLIFPTLELRIMELSLSVSTLDRLKHFITVPAKICASHPAKVTEKMKMYSIQEMYIENGWEGLRSGKFMENTGTDQRIDIEEHCRESCDSQMVPAAKRPRSNTLDSDTASGSHLFSATDLVRVHMDLDMDTVNSDSAIDNLRTTILEMKNELAEENRKLQKDLIEVKTCVQEKEKRTIEQYELKLTEANHETLKMIEENQKLRSELDYLKGDMGVKDKKSIELAEENRKLRMNLIEVRSCEEEKGKRTIEQYELKLTEANHETLKMIEENQKLRLELDYLKGDVGKKNKKSIELAEENRKLRMDLIEVRSCEEEKGKRTIEQYELKLTEANHETLKMIEENQKLRSELDYLKGDVGEKDKKSIQLAEENRTLRMNLIEVKSCEEGKGKRTVEQYELKLTEANQETLKLTEKNLKLRVELDHVKGNEGKKDEKIKASERKLNDLKNLVGDMIPKLQNKIAVLEQKRREETANTSECDVDGPSESDKTSDETFETDDLIVKKCRPILLKCEFGWMKFSECKNSKFCPGFVHPADVDGRKRAQKVTQDGYVTNSKNTFFDFHQTISEDDKDSAQKRALKKLNEKFKFSLS